MPQVTLQSLYACLFVFSAALSCIVLVLKCRLKLFVPITLLAFGVLVPVNWTGETLDKIDDLTFSNVDKLSISNVPPGSPRYWRHISIVLAYLAKFISGGLLSASYRELH